MEALVSNIFEIVLTGLATILVFYFKNMNTNVENMSRSMIDMNIKLEKVVTDQSWHHREIKEIKDRISDLEHKG
jgi:predicted  nucleic acid-binding Zn-ribbon protein